MKNENEYKVDGKCFIKEIKKCRCLEKRGEAYVLECRIHERGVHQYLYQPGQKRILRLYESKGFYLDEPAQKTVIDAVKEFQERVRAFNEGKTTRVQIVENKVTLILKQTEERFMIQMEYLSEEGLSCSDIYYDCSIEDVIKDTYEFCWRNGCSEMADILFESDEETILQNPIYAFIKNTGNEYLADRIKLHYRIASPEECKRLSDRLGITILPSLPKEFDRKYFVPVDQIDLSMLRQSGYKILHRPYFAMKGSTHSVWTLNPHTKIGVDAALTEEPVITFAEYLSLFGNRGK